MPSTIVENKTGITENVYDTDSGQVREDGTNQVYDYFEPGANVEIVKGDSVTFVKVTTPSGRIIVRDIKRPL